MTTEDVKYETGYLLVGQEFLRGIVRFNQLSDLIEWIAKHMNHKLSLETVAEIRRITNAGGAVNLEIANDLESWEMIIAKPKSID